MEFAQAVWNHRQVYEITVRCMESPSGVWNHRQAYRITVRRMESPSGVWNQALDLYGITPACIKILGGVSVFGTFSDKIASLFFAQCD